MIGSYYYCMALPAQRSGNWQSTSWLDTLTTAGYRCIAPDHRGHGESTKFYNPTDYGPDIFASDAIKLLDHLGIDKCAVLGFSMGFSRICVVSLTNIRIVLLVRYSAVWAFA